MNKDQVNDIKAVIKKAIRNKISKYNPETKSMPFHFRLLGKDRMALFSFIHSLNTTFGTSIFEPVAEILARNKFDKAVRQYIVGDEITEHSQSVISRIINDLSMGNDPDKLNEIKVEDEFWNFLGGEGAYVELLQCFEEVGIEIRDEIDERFSQFK